MTQINSDHQHNSLNADANNFWLVSIFGGFVCLLIAGLLVGFLFTGGNKEPEPQVEVAAKTSPAVDKTPIEKNPPVKKKTPVEIQPKEDTTQPEIEPMVPLPAPKEKAIPNKEPSLLIAPFIKQQAEEKQAAWAKHLGTKEVETNSIGIKLILIPAGEFMMGSGKSAKDISTQFPTNKRIQEYNYTKEHPQHKVRITKPFYLATTEVTQKQWESLMGTTPWKGQRGVKEGNDYAATYVSWLNVNDFIRRLNQKEGAKYRLPTEAEWEFSCRAGSEKTYYFGDEISKLHQHAWFDANSFDTGERYAHRVGVKKVNNFGLSDMYGNVWEWCSDWHDKDYYNQFANKVANDPLGPSKGLTNRRVLRGGSWKHSSGSPRYATRPRSALRGVSKPNLRNYFIGFRLVRNP